MTLRVVSYGGGVQSTALLVLAARRRIDFPTFLMANVGDDSEDPRTLDFVRDVAAPYAEKHGIDLHLLDRVRRDGTVETLMGRLLDPVQCRACKGSGVVPVGEPVDSKWADPDYRAETPSETCEACEGVGSRESRSLPIPVRMDNGAPGNRSCTADFKIKVTGKWLKAHGATGGKACREHAATGALEGAAPQGVQVDCPKCVQPNVATIGIGISRDEIMRANSRRVDPHENVVYPLIGLGEETGLNMNRQDCIELIRSEGLPVPPKSSCYFCPFHRPDAWVELRRERPDLFDKSVELERTLNERRTRLGKDPVWLTRFAQPLDEAIGQPEALLPMFDDTDDSCDSGRCFT